MSSEIDIVKAGLQKRDMLLTVNMIKLKMYHPESSLKTRLEENGTNQTLRSVVSARQRSYGKLRREC